MSTHFSPLLAVCVLFSSMELIKNTHAAEAEPQKVEVGVYINEIGEVNLKESKVDLDFYVWFRWHDSDLKPFETFELVNGQINSRDGLTELDLGPMKYACVRIRATLHKMWNVARFPLDDHEIELRIESNEAEIHKQIFLADTKNSRLNEEARVAGWKVVAGEATVGVHKYATNYGDISLPTGAESVYSQFVYSIRISRPSYSLFIKLFSGLYVSAAIGFLSLAIRPIDLDPRFGLGVGAMFAAVASQYVLSSNLPDSQGLTMADNLHILTFAHIFVTLLESTISVRLWNNGFELASKRLDRLALGLLLSTYIGGSALIVLLQF